MNSVTASVMKPTRIANTMTPAKIMHAKTARSAPSTTSGSRPPLESTWNAVYTDVPKSSRAPSAVCPTAAHAPPSTIMSTNVNASRIQNWSDGYVTIAFSPRYMSRSPALTCASASRSCSERPPALVNVSFSDSRNERSASGAGITTEAVASGSRGGALASFLIFARESVQAAGGNQHQWQDLVGAEAQGCFLNPLG